MLATTNSKTNEILEVLEYPKMQVSPIDREAALAELAGIRADVETRANPAEYLELAKQYDAIGASHNADAMRRKAKHYGGVA